MKNLFSKVESPLEQMANSLDMYSDPTASFIAEGPKFYFGKETETSPDLDPDDRSELDKQADELLAGHIDPPTDDDDDNVDDIGDFDVSDEGDIVISPTDDQLAAERESDWDFSDLDDPDALISKETPEEEVVIPAHVRDAAEDLKSIADKLKFFPTDDTAPVDVKLALAKIQDDIAALKASLGEGVKDMFDNALKLLNEEAGQVVPTSGKVNGVSILSKYQDPTSGEVFVKAVDGRIFCVTVGMNGTISEVKRTSFNPAFPDAFVRTDKNAIDALGASSTPKI
ncbi:MAG: hypothetical protein JHC33_00635 [Ignisphaera sp.]|nr:hypothetical protein [Ignisphaera sp.]